jgi:cytochrome P450
MMLPVFTQIHDLSSQQSRRRPPGPAGYTAVHNTLHLLHDALGLLLEMQERYGDVVLIPMPFASFYAVFHPDGVRHVLQENHRNYNYVTHRHPAFWERPLEFDPERFSIESTAGRPRFAYFPFGGGPRLCIGNQFALSEAQLILATILSRFQLRLLPGAIVTPEPLVTLRPRGDLLMTVRRTQQVKHLLSDEKEGER